MDSIDGMGTEEGFLPGVLHLGHGVFTEGRFVFKPIFANSDAVENGLPEEVRISMDVSHPFVVKTHDFWREGDHFMLKMDYCESGDLESWIGESKNLNIKIEDKLELVTMIALGIHYLHEKGICHRDIKSRNIFLKKKGVPCVGDFGLSCQLREDELPDDFERVGTLPYMAPEVLDYDPCDKKSDDWSFGVLVYEVFMSRRPFDNPIQKYMLMDIRGGKCRTPPSVPGFPEMENAILSLLKVDREERSTVEDFLKCDCIQATMKRLLADTERFDQVERDVFASAIRG